MKDIVFSKEKDIIAVIEYGSYARGDNDEMSDYDVFVLTKKISARRKSQLKKRLSDKILYKKYDLSIYDKETFNLMLKHGSLFLWHLKLEGKVIYQKRKGDLFISLEPFRGSEEDMFLYKRIFKGSKENIQNKGINFFDLSMLATITRNTLIILCYKYEKPDFGRKTVYDTASSILNENLPIDIDTYNELIDYRFKYARGIANRELPDAIRMNSILHQTNELICLVMDKLDLKNNIDRVTALIENKIDRDLYSSYEISTSFERDLYTALVKVCRDKYNYDLQGLNEIHQELFIQTVESSDNNIVMLGFKIYNSFEIIKKETSTYGPESNNIFKSSGFSNNGSAIVNKISEISKDYTFINKITDFNFLGLGTLIENLQIYSNKGNFLNDAKEFSNLTSKYLK